MKGGWGEILPIRVISLGVYLYTSVGEKCGLSCQAYVTACNPFVILKRCYVEM